jgi:hypothetical protein
MPSDSEQLLRAATYLKWWSDGEIAGAEVPGDIGQLIVLLERLAGQLERDVPDEWESAPPRGFEAPEDE